MPNVELHEFVADQEELLVKIYLEQLAKKFPKQKQLLERFLPLSSPTVDPALVAEFQSLDIKARKQIASHLARIADLQTKVRNNINGKYSEEVIKDQETDAASFGFVLNKLHEKGVTRQQLESIIKRILISNAITAHPTNPFSAEYTAHSMELDRIMAAADSDEKTARLIDGISRLIEIEVVSSVDASNSGNKTQTDEVKEALIYMENIFNAIPICKRILEGHLAKYDEYKDIEIDRFYDPCVWLTGDGDGNPNATAKSLEENIKIFKETIVRLYVDNLDQIAQLIEDSKLKERIDIIKEKLSNNFYRNPEELLAEIDEFRKDITDLAVKERLQDLSCRVKIFGFRYAKIDIRHDASDITQAVAEILLAMNPPVIDEEQKQQFLDQIKKGEEIGKWSDFLSAELSKLDDNKIAAIDKSKLSKTARRVFERLQVVAKYPGCSDKLIIAECKNPVNALAALFLLKASGNKVGEEGSINVVTLSESAKDLLALSKNLEQLLENETYRNHVAKNGKLIFMIAKSDTQRRNGPGAVFSQEKVVENVTRLVARLAVKYPELADLQSIAFNGGGHSLQRGGGRMDELPNVYTKKVLRGLLWPEEDSPEMGVVGTTWRNAMLPFLTTQGWQNSILFGAGSASHFFERLFSQGVWAMSKLDNIIAEPEVADEDGIINQNARKARRYRETFSIGAQEKFEELIGVADDENSALTRVNSLFARGPWVSCHLGNVSSRPNKRNDGGKDSDPSTVLRFKGKDPRFNKLRAIFAEKICSHSMTNLLTWISVADGLESVMGQYGEDAIVDMYASDKATRDSFRSIAIALFMADFEISWKMLIGKDRPSSEEIARLNQEYLENKFDDDEMINHQRTLAYIETEANKTAGLIYFAISGNKAEPGFTYKDLLPEFWFEIAGEIKHREEYLHFAHLIEAELTDEINKMQLNDEIDHEMLQLLRITYAACDATNAPVGSMNTLTKTNGNNRPAKKHIELSEQQQERLIIFDPKMLQPGYAVMGHSSSNLVAKIPSR